METVVTCPGRYHGLPLYARTASLACVPCESTVLWWFSCASTTIFPLLLDDLLSWTVTTSTWAIPSYQRRPSSLRKSEGNVRFPTNLHGVHRSARPTSRWAPKAHHMMGKTQWRHCERSFGTNVLVLGKQRDKFASPSMVPQTHENEFVTEHLPN